MSKKIRLSQCMIVKNEEKNIKKALTWAKDIAFEQIVVDTGSTDRTVEIAKEMGAKVYHFAWCDDFAAAKNYAIEQATGDWIAFLDADEYMQPEHSKALLGCIQDVVNKQKNMEKIDFIRCSWIHLNDKEHPFAMSKQDRLFRNHPSIRYVGKIHEQIHKKGAGKLRYIDLSEKIAIYHTGYSSQAFKDTKKANRNIELLRKEVEKEPENYNAWSYLGESLASANQVEEAHECMRKVLLQSPGKNVSANRYEAAQTIYLRTAITMNKTEEDILEIVKSMGYPNPQNINLIFFLGIYYQNTQKFEKAFIEFERYMQLVEKETKMDSDLYGNVQQVCIWLTELARRLDRPQQVVHYGVLALRSNRYLDGVLCAILECFSKEKAEKENANGTYGFLEKLYDYSKKKDLYFIYKCAKITNFYALQDKLFKYFTQEEQKELRFGKEVSYLEVENIPPINEVNKEFLKWIEKYQGKEAEDVKQDIVLQWEAIKKASQQLYTQYIDYHNKYQFWGEIDLEQDIYDSFEKRGVLIQDHMKDFIWLYQNLSDYCSRRTLLAILKNWTSFDTKLLAAVKRNERCYFDLDLIPTAKDEVFVDLGAYLGDTIVDFVSSYDKSYKKIYAYECSKDNIEKLERVAMRYERVQICPKAVGKESGSLFMKQGVEASSNRITDKETDTQEKGYMVPVVSLDEDIKEPVTWIKMDIEGAEYDALLGAREHIINDKPKLSISVYHGYDDLWRIPRLIHEINPDYDFYLRHYGGNLIPTEYVLTAIPRK